MNNELKEGFITAHEKLVELQTVLLKGDFEASKVVYDAAISLYSAVGEFIQSLEEAEVRSDENLDIEKTKLPSLDELFKNNPVTEYVNAAIAVAQFPNSPDAKKAFTEAVLKVAAHQEQPESEDEPCTYPECDCSDENTCPQIMSLQEFIEHSEEEYANEVMGNMNLIEEELKGKTTFSLADLYLIRYYLKRKPYLSDYEIESMSDEGLIRAWKQIEYTKNIR